MGDANHSCRGFETPSLGSDLWPMGFDVDLALEAPGARRGHGSGLSSGLVSGGLNSLHSNGNPSNNGYNDINHLTGLSSILQRSDDLHPGDICQMTDLTNSLPKGDSESAQSLLAKLACHDLGPDLTSGVDASQKEIETALFDQNPGAVSHGTGNGVHNVLSQHKNSLESADVYGRMTCYGGKLILQLRHFNLNTNYTLNVTECWLCGDKIHSGTQLCPHKHSLNGLFQVNDEYVQMEIEHYIIPEHALDPPDSQDMTDSMLQHSDPSALHHDMTTPRDLEIPGNLTGSGDTLDIGGGNGIGIGGSGGVGIGGGVDIGDGGGVGIGDNGATLHYAATPDTGLMPPLSVAPNLMSHAMGNQNPCLNPSFGQLPLPSMSVTNNATGMNSSILRMVKNESMPAATQPMCSVNAPVSGCTVSAPVIGMVKNESMTAATQSLCSSSTPVIGCAVSAPVMGLTHSEAVPSNGMMSTQLQRKLPVQNNQMSLVNNYAVDNVLTNFSVDDQMNTPMPNQSVLRDIPGQNKHTLQYHLPFSDGEYSCHASDGVGIIIEKQHDDSCVTPLHSTPLNFESHTQRAEVPITPKRTDIGSKKRKGRVQRKPRVSQDTNNRLDALESVPPKNFIDGSSKKCSNDAAKTDCLGSASVEYRQITRSDASFVEDWIRQNLPEDDLIVTQNQLKSSSDIESRLIASDPKFESKQTEKELPEKSPRLIDNLKSREPDQTSRLAAHMLAKGIDLCCRICQNDFGKDVRVYKIHMKEHGLEESELFACSFCPKTFSKGKHYTQHLKIHVKNHRFSCRLCTASYTREAKFRRHMLTHSQERPKKEFECSICCKSFTAKYYLQSHLKSHNDKQFKCDTCGILCSNPYNLDIHKKKHSFDKPFKCELCEKTFLRRDFLDHHMETVHKSKKLKCDVCGKLFSRKDVLKRHLTIHNNELYDCEICTKRFTRKDTLASHIKSHKSITPYKCSLCPSSFSRKFMLDKHEKIHKTKEQCSICCLFFPSKQRLINHMKLHSPENAKDGGECMQKCEICGKSLTSKGILIKHMRRIHGKLLKTKKKVKPIEREKRFFCQWCSKGFTRSCNLNSHLLKAHTKDTEDEFDDDLPSVLKSKLDSSSATKHANTSSLTSSSTNTSSYQTVPTSVCSATTVGGLSGANQNTNLPVVGPFPTGFPSSPSSSPPPHPPPALPVSSHFPSSGPPDSPINLSTDAITAAAYLLAYLSYPGPY